MKYIYIILLAVAVVACKKSEVDLVEKFVQEVKAEEYDGITLPAFNASHIDALMQHAWDDQIVLIILGLCTPPITGGLRRFEEELGYPKGWTNIPGETEDDRLKAIRSEIAYYDIDHILITYLGKNRFGEEVSTVKSQYNNHEH